MIDRIGGLLQKYSHNLGLPATIAYSIQVIPPFKGSNFWLCNPPYDAPRKNKLLKANGKGWPRCIDWKIHAILSNERIWEILHPRDDDKADLNWFYNNHLGYISIFSIYFLYVHQSNPRLAGLSNDLVLFSKVPLVFRFQSFVHTPSAQELQGGYTSGTICQFNMSAIVQDWLVHSKNHQTSLYIVHSLEFLFFMFVPYLLFGELGSI